MSFSKEKLILELLQGSKNGLSGLELIKSSGGRLKRGTVYVWLQRLQDKGLVVVNGENVEGRTRYSLKPSEGE